MEFIHDHLAHIGSRSLAESDNGEDFRGAAEDRRVAIDRRVARGKPDVRGAELPAQREPLFVDERLDRARVNAAAALSERLELECHRDKRFSRDRRRVEDDVALLENLQAGPPLAPGKARSPRSAANSRKRPRSESLSDDCPARGKKS